ncbi:hypothetical protein B1992_10170 [Pseudoxanthomonas broegbernensis]|uniref:Uncharacterized protein n=1 Tax=Pseudoxanthomonas broegbernensis TaxID=83619 RepID=A0A7V8K733_9GAMM|nr:DUF6445 family protein [Pseudoxanthomonas broegbernensis]KAF1686058.1 hypothetical protein B1992_10170 [Pseudoxanthomonas broegbernensis]MBB6063683.1 hypothetical protein [Pseudoxanthomonas broegbernensis]
MILDLSPDLRIQRRSLGNEGAPLLIVDSLLVDPDRLVRKAARSQFVPQSSMFPGIRANAPSTYPRMLEQLLRPLLEEHFGLPRDGSLAFPMCHYSLVTTPPAQLAFLQRVPHIDSHAHNGLATVHYLFRGDWGGTAFYRHRSTGYEYVDHARKLAYFTRLEEESRSEAATPPGYIGDDTPLFERIDRVDAVFDRLVVYRRNSLHSGAIDNRNVPPPDPVAGRLSVNSFIDVLD